MIEPTRVKGVIIIIIVALIICAIRVACVVANKERPPKAKMTVYNLGDPGFWVFYRSLIISSAIILLLTILLSILSVKSHSAYKERKTREVTLQMEQDAIHEDFIKQKALQMDNLVNKLDSIDVHVQAVVSTQKSNKKKTNK